MVLNQLVISNSAQSHSMQCEGFQTEVFSHVSIGVTVSITHNNLLFTSQDFPEFIEDILDCLESLEWFSYIGPLDNGLGENNPEIPNQDDEDITFSSLKYVYIKFHLCEKDDPEEKEAIIENFKQYLTVKCPRLTNPIQVNDNHSTEVIFESR